MSVKHLDISELAKLAKCDLYENPPKNPTKVGVKKILTAEEMVAIYQARVIIFLAISRVEKFCDYQMYLPGTSFERKMLENGKSFASKAKQYLIGKPNEADVPLDPVLSDRKTGYYRHVVKSLEAIDVEYIGDFIPCWESAEDRARLRRAWNISVGSAKHPTFLAFLVPNNRKERFGCYD